MPHRAARNPLHGLTLETILNDLVARVGWKAMSEAVDIRCFTFEPSVKSSLHFLRRTPWARKKVEELYLKHRPKGGSADSQPATSLRENLSYDRAALKAHELNRAHARFKCDNGTKI